MNDKYRLDSLLQISMNAQCLSASITDRMHLTWFDMGITRRPGLHCLCVTCYHQSDWVTCVTRAGGGAPGHVGRPVTPLETQPLVVNTTLMKRNKLSIIDG